MKMKKTMLCMMVGATLLATSCLSEQQNLEPKGEGSKKGEIVLSVDAQANFEEQTRAVNEANYRNNMNYTVRLLQEGEVIGQWTGPQTTMNLEREIGENNYYTVEAFYGKEHAASRDEFYVYGSSTFELKPNAKKTVNVICNPTCGKLIVDFDADMAQYYSDYSVTYGGTKALGNTTIDWQKADTEPWYVKLDAAGESVSYRINLKTKDEYAHVNADGSLLTNGVVSGSFTLKPNEAKRLKIKPKYISSGVGTFSLEIVIDEGTNDHDIEQVVPVEWL